MEPRGGSRALPGAWARRQGCVGACQAVGPVTCAAFVSQMTRTSLVCLPWSSVCPLTTLPRARCGSTVSGSTVGDLEKPRQRGHLWADSRQTPPIPRGQGRLDSSCLERERGPLLSAGGVQSSSQDSFGALQGDPGPPQQLLQLPLSQSAPRRASPWGGSSTRGSAGSQQGHPGLQTLPMNSSSSLEVWLEDGLMERRDRGVAGAPSQKRCESWPGGGRLPRQARHSGLPLCCRCQPLPAVGAPVHDLQATAAPRQALGHSPAQHLGPEHPPGLPLGCLADLNFRTAGGPSGCRLHTAYQTLLVLAS